MVDYSKWDRLDLGDSDSDAGDANAGGVDWVVGAPPRSNADLKGHEDDAKIEKMRYANGDVYEGEVRDGKAHGRGVCRHSNGNVYNGEWKDDMKHGFGTLTSVDGNVTEGEWENDQPNGRVTVKASSGNIYVGMAEQGKMHGKGVFRWKEGDVYDGEWVEGKQHGKGTVTKASGEVFDEEWVDGQRVWAKARGVGTSPGASEGKQSEMKKRTNEQPTKDQRRYVERTLRSAESQQRRLERNVEANKCENCGVDEYHYKLRVCSGCNLALYCSATCQKAASRSHQRICDIISQLPSKDSDRLVLEFDRDKMADLDAGLRYGTKHMDNLKHLQLNVRKMVSGNAIKLSTKKLSSLLRSKKGKLDSVFLLSSDGYDEVHGAIETNVWKELHSLKQLRLFYMRFDDVQPVCDIIDQQRDTLTVLGLPFLGIQWRKAKPRRTVAQAIGACKHLVALDMGGCVLMDSDLKVMLQDLINLRTLNLRRYKQDSHEFTDNTCGLIARKCPGLQELDLDHHNQLSVRGIRKIFESAPVILHHITQIEWQGHP